MPGYCVLWKSSFLSRAVLFDCSLANWSCMLRPVKDDMLVCMVSAVKLILWKLSWCFASLVCFTRDLTHLKENLSWLCQILVSPSLWKVILLFAWLFCLLSSTFRLICLFVDFVIWCSGTQRFNNYFLNLFAEKGTHLGHWQTFLVFLVVNF